MLSFSRMLRQAALPLLLAAFVLPSFAETPNVKLGAFIGAMETEYPDWFKNSFLDFADDVEGAASNGKRIMILFHQDNCPYCNVLVERNMSQKDIVEFLQKHFEVVTINMWGDREVATVAGESMSEKEFSAALKVQFTPTMLILDEKGDVALRLNGYIPPARFKLALQYAADKTYAGMTFREFTEQRLPNATGSTAGAGLIAQSFFASSPASLASDGKPIALFFEQADCPNCDYLHGTALKDAETLEIVQKFHNVQLDMWSNTPVTLADGSASTARKLAQSLDVQYAPTLVLLDASGTEIIRAEAEFKSFHVQSIFDYLLSDAYKTEPSFQRYLSARAEHIRETGRDVNIWE